MLEIVKPGDLILISDFDELIAAETVQLLKSCTGYGLYLHLEMMTFMYSFEFVDSPQRRVMVAEIPSDSKFEYDHKRRSSKLLASAGWHCSWCFRKIQDFQFKMQAYSHSDRATKYTMDARHIQEAICAGTSVENMLPEAYSFSDLTARLGPLKKNHDYTRIPRIVVDNAKKWPYLLAGGCNRTDGSPMTL